MTDKSAISAYSVTDKFSRNLALLICDFVRSGSFKTSVESIDALRRPSFVHTDEDGDTGEYIEIVGSGENRTYWCEVDFRMDRNVSITFVAPIGETITPAHTVPGMAFGLGKGVTPCTLPVPDQLCIQTRTLDLDGTYQAIFDVGTNMLFVSWPAPHAREHCVASFRIPEEVVRSLS